jgi:hypothetical protein
MAGLVNEFLVDILLCSLRVTLCDAPQCAVLYIYVHLSISGTPTSFVGHSGAQPSISGNFPIATLALLHVSSIPCVSFRLQHLQKVALLLWVISQHQTCTEPRLLK